MAKISILEGYGNPFSAYRRKRRKSRKGGRGKQVAKMRSCAAKWRKSGKRGKYTSFMKACLRK